MIWLPSKRGVYTSKLGYSLLTLSQVNSMYVEFDWQANIWRLKAIPKAKYLLWKAAIGALPVGEQLLHRGIHVDPCCKRCGTLETILHVFRDCSFAQQVWDAAPINSQISSHGNTFLQFLLEAKYRSLYHLRESRKPTCSLGFVGTYGSRVTVSSSPIANTLLQRSYSKL